MYARKDQMVDVVDKITRSRMMAGIRGKDTRPEMALRRALHREGLRFRLHVIGLPGRPDGLSETSRRDPGSWLLLAQACELRLLHQPRIEQGILEIKVRRNGRTRSAKPRCLAKAWLESCDRLGVFSEGPGGRDRRSQTGCVASIQTILQGNFEQKRHDCDPTQEGGTLAEEHARIGYRMVHWCKSTDNVYLDDHSYA